MLLSVSPRRAQKGCLRSCLANSGRLWLPSSVTNDFSTKFTASCHGKSQTPTPYPFHSPGPVSINDNETTSTTMTVN